MRSSGMQTRIVWGRITSIEPDMARQRRSGTIGLDVYDVGAALHPKFDMPVLLKRSDALANVSVSSEVSATDFMQNPDN
jgi:hypothetical protein